MYGRSGKAVRIFVLNWKLPEEFELQLIEMHSFLTKWNVSPGKMRMPNSSNLWILWELSQCLARYENWRSDARLTNIYSQKYLLNIYSDVAFLENENNNSLWCWQKQLLLKTLRQQSFIKVDTCIALWVESMKAFQCW